MTGYDSLHYPVPATDSPGAPPGVPRLSSRPNDTHRTLVHPEARVPLSALPPTSSSQMDLPKFAVVTGSSSRMSQTQFLNRDTYGTVGPVNRPAQDSSAYQLIHDATTDIRERYEEGSALNCRPFTISAAQSEFLGRSRDKYGRKSYKFLAVNADIGGYNTDTDEPFSRVGHLLVELFVPPTGFATIRSTNVPVSRSRPTPPACDPSSTTSYCIPPLEADAREVGRAIQNSVITHGMWQPARTYKWHIIGPDEVLLSPIGATWEYMGDSEDGYRRWRETLPTISLPNHEPVEFRGDPLPFDEDIPDIPDDPLPEHRVTRTIMPESPISFTNVVVAQVPDPTDRFSRPVPRYTIPVRHEEALERIARTAADLSRTIRQNQKASFRYPPHYVLHRPPNAPSAPNSEEESDDGSELSQAGSPTPAAEEDHPSSDEEYSLDTDEE
ncbi:hypothetical protein DFH09DRAFT_1412074 [Mycena vulgaris]|nr:hypothetical protein DFH09DRAFT_1412074 [Mycena vulgaris]